MQQSKAQIQNNIASLLEHYNLTSLDTLTSFLTDPKKAYRLPLPTRNEQINLHTAQIFASKYTFQQLVQKYPRPRSAINRQLLKILQLKMKKSTISSHQTRKNIWLLASGAKFNMLNYKDLYNSLLSISSYPPYYQKDIEQDLLRTTPIPQQRIQLRNVLTAFSRRNPYIGYCQGLNSIAYFLLTLQFTQQQSFWLLSLIIQTIIPMDYYTNMVGVVCDQHIYLSLLTQLNPKIVLKFKQLQLDPSMISIQWFVCLFTSTLPLYLTKILWDHLLIQGTMAIIKAAIIVTRHYQPQIMAATQFRTPPPYADDVLKTLDNTLSLNIPEEQFNGQLNDIYLHKEGLDIARVFHSQYYLMNKIEKYVQRNAVTPIDKPCNLGWPICIHLLEQNKKERTLFSVWIFKEEVPILVIQDYLVHHEHTLKTQLKKGETVLYTIIQSVPHTILQSVTHTILQSVPHRVLQSVPHRVLQSVPLKVPHTQQKQQSKRKNINNSDFENILRVRMQSQGLAINKETIVQEQQQEEEKVLQLVPQCYVMMGRMHHICNPKMYHYNGQSCQEQYFAEEQQKYRSHTQIFYNKFVRRNKEISMIFGEPM